MARPQSKPALGPGPSLLTGRKTAPPYRILDTADRDRAGSDCSLCLDKASTPIYLGSGLENYSAVCLWESLPHASGLSAAVSRGQVAVPCHPGRLFGSPF